MKYMLFLFLKHNYLLLQLVVWNQSTNNHMLKLMLRGFEDQQIYVYKNYQLTFLILQLSIIPYQVQLLYTF